MFPQYAGPAAPRGSRLALNLQNAPFSALLIQDVANFWAVVVYCEPFGGFGPYVYCLGIRRGEHGLCRSTGLGTRPSTLSFPSRRPSQGPAPGQLGLR